MVDEAQVIRYLQSLQSSTDSAAFDLIKSQIEFKVAEGYFSHILNAQLTIFVLIVSILSALSIYLQYRMTKGQINKEVLKSTKVMRKNIKKDFKNNMLLLDKKISEHFESLEIDIANTRGNTYRSLALFWDNQKSYAVAFIWWVRAASLFAKAYSENMVKISLGGARQSMSLIGSATDITPADISEYEKLMSEIDDKLYKTEKSSLDETMKRTLTKKIQP